jgi:putative FmdB family regulatory protein
MPMYEYKCGQCGEVFELIQRFSDEPLKTHEGCGGSVERLVSAPAFQFKGSGWYVTDYAKSGNPATPAAKNGGTDSKPAAGSTEGSSSSSSSPSTSSPSTSTSSDSKK